MQEYDYNSVPDPFDENIILTGPDGQVSDIVPREQSEIDPTVAVGFLISIAMIAMNNPFVVPELCREDAFRDTLRALEAIGVPPSALMMGAMLARHYAEEMGAPVHHLGSRD
jgi:hypothetical protein